jgi:hypothetical protein
MKEDFFAKTEKIKALAKPSLLQMDDYTTSYLHYRDALQVWESVDMAAITGLSIIDNYSYVLLLQHKNEESMEEIKFGYDHFLKYLRRGDARCYAPFKGTYSYNKQQIAEIVSGFFEMGVFSAIRLNDYAFAKKLMMAVDEREMMARTYPTADACAYILNNKVYLREIDDTCFTAAYGCMLAKYSTLPKDQESHVISIDPMEVITDAKFINYKPARIKSYNYLDYHDYFSNLYNYLSDSSATDKELNGVLKMFCKVYFAEKKNHGVDQSFVKRLANGSDHTPDVIKKIIATGDTEFVRLMADFIDDAISKSGWYTDMTLLYGGYLLYRQLGEDKKAKKLYKRISKEPDPRFKKLD